MSAPRALQVAINQSLCRGDCVCELICPQVFVLDEGGIAHVVRDGAMLAGESEWAPVPAEEVERVREAVAACPENAILLREA